MAIVISDTNDRRKKVDLKLGKVALTPTIQAQSGPATRVQDISPIVKQGEQFLNNFNKLGKVYGDAVDVFTEKGKEEAKQLDEAGFQDALKNISGDSFSLFGKTKAFNEGLVERYFATEVPFELQKIDEEMQANITQYGSLDKFQEATAQRLNKYFDTLGEQFDENVFTNRALGAYSSVVKQKMLLSSNEKYLAKIDAFNTEEANNKAHRAVDGLKSPVDVAHVNENGITGLGATLTLVDNKISETITDPTERNKVLTGSVFGKLTNAIKSNDFTYADSILDIIEDDEFSVNGKQIFNTAEAGLKVEELRAVYDTALKKYEREQLPIDSATGTNSAMLEITSAIRLEGEDVGIELANKYLDEIAKTGSITIGDETYTNPIVVGDIQKEIRAATFNPQVFVKLADDRLMAASSTGINDYLNGKNGILNEKQIKALIEETVELSNVDASTFYLEGTNDLNETITIGISTDLSDIIADVKTHSNELMQEIIDTIPADITQPNDKAQYIQDQIKEKGLREQLKQKLIDSIKSYAPSGTTGSQETNQIIVDLKANGYTEEQIEQIKITEGNNFNAAAKEALRREEAEDSYYNISSDGNVSTRGLFVNDRYASFQEADEEDAFISSENKLEEHNKVSKKINKKGLGNFLFDSIVNIRLGEFKTKSDGYTKIAETIKTVGINQDELLTGKIIATPSDAIGGLYMSADSNYGTLNINTLIAQNRISFDTFGIQLNKSFAGTIQAIKAYEEDNTNVNSTIRTIADKYGMDVSELYALQRKYFEQNGYLK